jgi:hypothetical protein
MIIGFPPGEPRHDKQLARTTHNLFLAAVQEKGCLGHPHDNVPRTAFSASAHAATFTVNSFSGVVDTSPGNGICETVPGKRHLQVARCFMEASKNLET